MIEKDTINTPMSDSDTPYIPAKSLYGLTPKVEGRHHRGRR